MERPCAKARCGRGSSWECCFAARTFADAARTGQVQTRAVRFNLAAGPEIREGALTLRRSVMMTALVASLRFAPMAFNVGRNRKSSDRSPRPQSLAGRADPAQNLDPISLGIVEHEGMD